MSRVLPVMVGVSPSRCMWQHLSLQARDLTATVCADPNLTRDGSLWRQATLLVLFATCEVPFIVQQCIRLQIISVYKQSILASVSAGIVATTVAAPFDTLKSCVMADDGDAPGHFDTIRILWWFMPGSGDF